MAGRQAETSITRLCSKADTATKALEMYNQIRLRSLPGSGYDLSQGLVGIPAICSYLASQRLGNADVSENMAHQASCLSKSTFAATMETMKRIMDSIEAKKKLPGTSYEELMEHYDLGDDMSSITKVLSILDKRNALVGRFEATRAVVICATFWWVCNSLGFEKVAYQSLMDKYKLDYKDFCDVLDIIDKWCMDIKAFWKKWTSEQKGKKLRKLPPAPTPAPKPPKNATPVTEATTSRPTYKGLMAHYELGEDMSAITSIVDLLNQNGVLVGKFNSTKPTVICAIFWWVCNSLGGEKVTYQNLMENYNLDFKVFCEVLDLMDHHCGETKKEWKEWTETEIFDNQDTYKLPPPPSVPRSLRSVSRPTTSGGSVREASLTPLPNDETSPIAESASAAPVKRKRNRKPKGPWFIIVSESEGEQEDKKKVDEIPESFDGRRRTRASASAARASMGPPPGKKPKVEPSPAPSLSSLSRRQTQNSLSTAPMPGSPSRITRAASAVQGAPEPLPLPPLRRNKSKAMAASSSQDRIPVTKATASAPSSPPPTNDDVEMADIETDTDDEMEVKEPAAPAAMEVVDDVDDTAGDEEASSLPPQIRRRYRPVFQDRVEWDMRDPWSERLLKQGQKALAKLAPQHSDAPWARALMQL